MSTPLPSDPALGLNIRPTLPRRKDWRIGCVGAGFIMADCHLVAYRAAGFNPVAIASRTATTAKSVAARHGITAVHAAGEDFHTRPEVEVVGGAVPPEAHPAASH